MANDLTSNPLRVDTAATIVAATAPIVVQAMQWVDDDEAAGGNIADGENLKFTFNGVSIGLNAPDISSVAPIAWSAHFPQPVRCNSLIVAAIDGGTLLVWKA